MHGYHWFKWRISHLPSLSLIASPLSHSCCYLTSQFFNCMQKAGTSVRHSWDVRLKKRQTACRAPVRWLKYTTNEHRLLVFSVAEETFPLFPPDQGPRNNTPTNKDPNFQNFSVLNATIKVKAFPFTRKPQKCCLLKRQYAFNCITWAVSIKRIPSEILWKYLA